MSLHTLYEENFYEGKMFVLNDQQKILIRSACVTDIPQIVSFLKSIQITPDKLKEKLSKTHQASFKKSGGFFVIWDAQELAKMLQDERNLILVAVARDRGREFICGFLWCRLNLDSIAVSDWQLDRRMFNDDQISKFYVAVANKRVFTAVECAIHSDYHGMGVTHIIIQEMYNWLWQRGYLFAVLQVYIIQGEYKQENFVKIELPNEASIKHIKSYGAVYMKEASLPVQIVGNRRFKVSADVFLLDLEYAVKKLKELTLRYLAR